LAVSRWQVSRLSILIFGRLDSVAESLGGKMPLMRLVILMRKVLKLFYRLGKLSGSDFRVKSGWAMS